MLPEHLPKETKQRIFEVSYAIYRVTALFPHHEALRYELRHEASEILKKCAQYSVLPRLSLQEILDIVGRVRGIQSLLNLARLNRFVKTINIEVLQKTYADLENFFSSQYQNMEEEKDDGNKEFEKALAAVNEKKNVFLPATNAGQLSEKTDMLENFVKPETKRDKSLDQQRKTIILDFLNKKDKSSIKDIANVFKDISTKTIQRDLNALISVDTVERSGDRRWAVYSLKERVSVASPLQSGVIRLESKIAEQIGVGVN